MIWAIRIWDYGNNKQSYGQSNQHWIRTQKYSSIYISRSSQTVGPCWQFDVENWDNWYWTKAIDHPLTQLCYCELQMIFTLSIIG